MLAVECVRVRAPRRRVDDGVRRPPVRQPLLGPLEQEPADAVPPPRLVDDEGQEVSVSLWNEEIERVRPDDRIRITNGWAREWRGNLQVTAGRYGKLEVLQSGKPGA